MSSSRPPTIEAFNSNLSSATSNPACVLGWHQRVDGDGDIMSPVYWARVAPSDWKQAAAAAQDAGFTYFSFLSGMDWLPNPNLNGEKHFVDSPAAVPQEIVTDEKVRFGGGESRFQVIARVCEPVERMSLMLVADLPENELTIATWCDTYAGANWHERETAEMFGFTFAGHPDPRRIYLSDEFTGYPLRKDFALASRLVRPWPGLVDMEEMPPRDEPPSSDQSSEQTNNEAGS